MSLNAVLEIVLSLAALYWLLASACSFVVEGLNSMLMNVRAKALERFVCEMIVGVGRVSGLRSFLVVWRRTGFQVAPSLNRGIGNGADPLGIFSHGLVQSLRKPQHMPGGDANSPSYIPSHIFSKVLLDRLGSLSWPFAKEFEKTHEVLIELEQKWSLSSLGLVFPDGVSGGEAMVKAIASLVDRLRAMPLHEAKERVTKLLDVVNSPDAQRAITTLALKLNLPLPELESVRHGLVRILEAILHQLSSMAASTDAGKQTLGEIVDAPQLWITVMRAAGEGLSRSPSVVHAVSVLVAHAPLPRSLKDSLRPYLQAADFDPAKLTQGIEYWYDSVMDRASGWFKRYTTVFLFCVGLVAAVVLNVDTFAITHDLAQDPALRTEGSAMAGLIVRDEGRTNLVQRISFNQLASSLLWADRTANLVSQTSMSGPLTKEQRVEIETQLRLLAIQIRPTLLISGAFAGLATNASAFEFASKWSETGSEPGSGASFRKKLCLSQLDGEAGGINRWPVGVDDRLQHEAQRTDLEPDRIAECSWMTTAAFKSDKPADVFGAFWASNKVVWAADLSKALNKALENVNIEGVAIDDVHKSLEEVSSQLTKTIAATNDATNQAKRFLDRIPSLGRTEELKAEWRYYFPTSTSFWGWLVTALMVSFGAPFWFDLMSKVVDKRATGPRPDSDSK